MADAMLQMHDITKTFPGVKALENVNLSVERGEIHAICGENGAGKSTLMKVLSGVYPHNSFDGEILVDGEPVAFSSINDSERLGIVIIHQELALISALSVSENIFLGNERRGSNGLIDWNRTHHEAAALLEQVGLNENPTTPVGQLGVGKQQLVEIAKALSKSVRLLILDEPTAALNDNDSEHLLDLLRRLKSEGITSIIISHKLNEVASIADRTTIIRDGRTVETIDMVVHGAGVDGSGAGSGSGLQERIIRGMVGRDLENFYPARDSTLGEEMFRIDDWTVMHPTQAGRVVVEGASLSVRAGEVVGIAGLMGAGRTELAMSIFGRSYGRVVSGTVEIHGNVVDTSTVAGAIRSGLAYVTEDRKGYGLNLIDDIRHNISAASLRRVARGGFVNANAEIAVAEGYRSDLGIKSPSVLSTVGQLSGGNQQKVVLGKWLHTEPEVLILDEPTRGIDVGAKFEIYGLINAMVAQGKAVVVISSELQELLGTCDRIYTVAFGRVTGEVETAATSQEELMHLMTIERSVGSPTLDMEEAL